MATTTSLITFRPTGIRACANSGHGRSDLDSRKSASSPNWWTPIFNWSAEPDYIDSGSNELVHDASEKPKRSSDSSKSSRPRFAPGSFTEEKARQLRMMTKETKSFHDAMYHSAIASRLASEFKNRSDQ
ncbi:uncharacterized protein LOC108979976 [Juglans regia]|uniref:Uncharacterized protein LOC108979976 n=1 Tax=Juglans regia TaxID=51240 RepID=A0A2I4GPV2_JUGRE|nr:uncharacterized protein LOC108979976 [Juglans regia]